MADDEIYSMAGSMALGINGDPALVDLAATSLRPMGEVLERLHFGHRLIIYYNLILVGVLGLLTVWYWAGLVQESRRRARDASIRHLPISKDQGEEWDHRSASPEQSSSSGSTSPGSSTPRLDLDERKPLLKPRRTASKAVTGRPLARFRAWMIYQPRNLPKINKVLPSNLTTLCISVFLGLNIFFLFFHVDLPTHITFLLGIRAGELFTGNLPLLYLLAAKNCPLRFLTGQSYENLNVVHRRLGELLCLLAVVHMATMLVVFLPLLTSRGITLFQFFTHPLIWLGFAAFFCYETLYVTSLASFRAAFYELFLASHIFLQAGALAFLYFHFHSTRVWVLISLAIIVIDRLPYRLFLSRRILHADLTILPDGETLLVSADWDLPSQPTFWQRLLKRDILTGWSATNHIFISAPSLGLRHVAQSHPFTIASAAPAPTTTTAPPHAWLNLLIRARSGFSAALLAHARSHPRIPLAVDGPYGSVHARDMLRRADTAVLVAGGSGVAVAWPLAWDLLRDDGGPLTVVFVWVVHDARHVEWVGGRAALDVLMAEGRGRCRVVVPPPTAEAGRPDVAGIVRREVEGQRGRVGVVVSGPDGLNREVRNACAALVGEGRDVGVAVEKFGW